MSKVRRRDVLLIVIVVLHLALTLDARRTTDGSAQLAAKVKRESRNSDGSDNSNDEVIYDQRQTKGETNIRLSIKNVKIQQPESQIQQFQVPNTMQLLQQSLLRLFGIDVGDEADSEETTTDPPDDVRPSTTERPLQRNLTKSLPELVASILQVNGSNFPAKYFFEISDFLMNTNDNDAVDDMRVQKNHNEQQRMDQEQLERQLHRFRQQQQQQPPQPSQHPAEEPAYGTEELTIERLENTMNVRNETITISKKRHQVGPLPTDGSALETVSKENHQSSNTTRNATESSDRFVQTKPIRLETVRVTVATEPKSTLREKVIWRMPSTESDDASDGR